MRDRSRHLRDRERESLRGVVTALLLPAVHRHLAPRGIANLRYGFTVLIPAHFRDEVNRGLVPFWRDHDEPPWIWWPERTKQAACIVVANRPALAVSLPADLGASLAQGAAVLRVGRAAGHRLRTRPRGRRKLGGALASFWATTGLAESVKAPAILAPWAEPVQAGVGLVVATEAPGATAVPSRNMPRHGSANWLRLLRPSSGRRPRGLTNGRAGGSQQQSPHGGSAGLNLRTLLAVLLAIQALTEDGQGITKSHAPGFHRRIVAEFPALLFDGICRSELGHADKVGFQSSCCLLGK